MELSLSFGLLAETPNTNRGQEKQGCSPVLDPR